MVCCMGWGTDDQESSKTMTAQRMTASRGAGVGSNRRQQGWAHGAPALAKTSQPEGQDRIRSQHWASGLTAMLSALCHCPEVT